jgi:phospholipid/cholesterol/gamma-HCH transport system substrate-binding protein
MLKYRASNLWRAGFLGAVLIELGIEVVMQSEGKIKLDTAESRKTMYNMARV